MRGRFLCVAGALGVGLAATVSAQRKPVPDPVVHTVRIDAIAVDARGGLVRNLKPADFDLREDGRPVSLDDAQFVTSGSEPSAGASDLPQPVRSSSDEEREAHRDHTRVVAVYFDEYQITPGPGTERAKEALNDLIDHILGPRDLLVVMKPLDSLFTLRLSHDRDDAHRIVAGLTGRRGDYTPQSAYERASMVGAPARVEAARNQVTISALNALALHMGGLNDRRKTLLVVTENLTRPTRRRGQEYLATTDALLRSANRSNVAIYPVDPRPAPSADSTPDDGRVVLGSLATDTDGRTVTGATDLPAALRGAVADADAYYLLTYRAEHKEDGGFHPVQVQVKRAGVRVRARAGFWAPSADDRLKEELVARANMPLPPIKYEPARHISPLIQPWFGVSLGENQTTHVSFVWEPATGVFGDRGRRVAARIELTVLSASDAVVFQGVVLPSGAGMIEEQGGEPSRVAFDVAPGRVRVRMKILDAARRELDADVREVLIRDLRSEVSIGTPEVLRARNAREFRAIDTDPAALPVASREFSRTERLLVRFRAYAPKGQDPQVVARLLNRVGQPMRTLDLRRAEDGDHEFDIGLSGLASGEYQFELSAVSPAGQTKETIGFRVTS
jgi:VWFA-related protein